MKHLLYFFHHYSHSVWDKGVFLVVQHAGSVVSVTLFGHLVVLLGSERVPALQLCSCVGFMCLLEVTSLLSQYGFQLSILKGTASATRRLKEEALGRLMQLDAELRESTQPGEWERRICGDTQMVASCAYPALWEIIGTLIAFVFVSGVLIYEHPVFLLLVLILGLAFYGVCLLNSGQLTLTARDARETNYNEGTILLDFLSLTPIMSLFRVTQCLIGRFSEIAQRVETTSVAVGKRTNAYTAHIRGVMLLGNMACLVMSVTMNRLGALSVGEMVANMMLVGQLSGQLAQLVFTVPSLNRGAESARSLNQAFGLLAKRSADTSEKAPADSLESTPTSGLLQLQDVSFAYSGGQPILRHLSWNVGSHEYHSILGRNGAGKSTLIKLILGSLREKGGSVTRGYKRAGYVPQTTVIFKGSLLDNITLCNGNVSRARVEEIIRTCHLDFLLQRLGSIEAEVTRGQLSGGETQRIGIARALVIQPDLLVVDEITNNLDIASKAIIFETLRALRRQCTIISISHDMEGLADSDDSWMLNHGCLRKLEGSTPEEKRRYAFALIKNCYHE